MNENGRVFYIRHLAKFLGVSKKTIKNWEREQHIPQPRRNKFEWRIYTQTDMDNIKRIAEAEHYFKQSKDLGLPK